MLWLDLWARAPRDPEVARDREVLDRKWRDTISDIVQSGQASGGPAPRTSKDRSRFLAKLDETINAVRRGRGSGS